LAALTDIPEEVFVISSLMLRDYYRIKAFKLADSVIETEAMGVMSIVRSARHDDWPEALAYLEQSARFTYGNLSSAVTTAVARSWRVDPSKLLARQEMTSTRAMCTIGMIGDTKIEDNVMVIRRSDR
jgi:hypothetical protein